MFIGLTQGNEIESFEGRVSCSENVKKVEFILTFFYPFKVFRSILQNSVFQHGFREPIVSTVKYNL